MSELSEKLLPCPFCGAEAGLAQEHDHAWIRHNGCPADLGGFESALDAVMAWNRRSVRVKPLEWEEGALGSWQSVTPLDIWYVRSNEDGTHWRRENHPWESCSSIEDGFASAQADYERRVRSTLAGSKALALQEELSAAKDALKRIAEADFLDFSLAPDRSAAAIAREALSRGGGTFSPHPDQTSPMTVGPEDYFEEPLVDRLRKRAKAAREEKNATALSDALHFEQAASDLERLHKDLAFWKSNSTTESKARIAAEDSLSEVKRVRDQYADQARFADHEPASYFREFVRRVDAALAKAEASS